MTKEDHKVGAFDSVACKAQENLERKGTFFFPLWVERFFSGYTALSFVASVSSLVMMSRASGKASGKNNVTLSPEEEKEFREVFNLVDRDKGGTISREELAQLMRTLSINASQVRNKEYVIIRRERSGWHNRKECRWLLSVLLSPAARA